MDGRGLGLGVELRVCRLHGEQMHYGKKTSRWRPCDALGSVLLGNIYIDIKGT